MGFKKNSDATGISQGLEDLLMYALNIHTTLRPIFETKEPSMSHKLKILYFQVDADDCVQRCLPPFLSFLIF